MTLNPDPLTLEGTRMRSGEVGNAGFCGKCQTWNPDGPDVCLGRLRGVTAACCGHGTQLPYVAFGLSAFDYDPATVTTIVLYGDQAEAYFAHVKATPDEPYTIANPYEWVRTWSPAPSRLSRLLRRVRGAA